MSRLILFEMTLSQYMYDEQLKNCTNDRNVSNGSKYLPSVFRILIVPSVPLVKVEMMLNG